MVDVIASVTNAVNVLKRLNAINETLKNAELKRAIADLSIELSEVRLRLAAVLDENVRLNERIRSLESADGDPCPKCRRRSWHLEYTAPDGTFGDLGVNRRMYRCAACGFSEERLDH